MFVDIPFLNKGFNQFNEKARLVWVYINDKVYVFLHMGTDISCYSDEINFIKCFLADLSFDLLYFIGQISCFDAMDISNNSLQAAS